MKILMLVHPDLIPPLDVNKKNVDRFSPWITEFDVKNALQDLGHEVEVFGVYDDINPLIEKLKTSPPKVVFNLLEEFSGKTQMDFHIVSLLELMGIAYTGCSAKGLMLARDKALAKKILKHHHIGTPAFFVLPKNKKRKLPKNIKFPLIVKCLYEEASFGIAKSSVVHSKEKLLERVKYIHEKLEQDVIIEEFIAGREFFIGITGNKQLKVYPIWELVYENVEDSENEIYTQRAKWNEKYRERKGINTTFGNLPAPLTSKIKDTCKKVFHLLQLSGCARIDIRLTNDEKIYVLEANPNPNLALDDELAKSAAHEKITYKSLIETILNMA